MFGERSVPQACDLHRASSGLVPMDRSKGRSVEAERPLVARAIPSGSSLSDYPRRAPTHPRWFDRLAHAPSHAQKMFPLRNQNQQIKWVCWKGILEKRADGWDLVPRTHGGEDLESRPVLSRHMRQPTCDKSVALWAFAIPIEVSVYLKAFASTCHPRHGGVFAHARPLASRHVSPEVFVFPQNSVSGGGHALAA